MGACLQILGTAAGIWLTGKLNFKASEFSLKNTVQNFCYFTIFESTFLALLSFLYFLDPLVLKSWFWLKACLGFFVVFQYKTSLFTLLKTNRFLSLICFALLVAISVPTANFDCFSAHFAIPRLFIEESGYPLRPDYQYLDALPLAGHMWYLPGLAAENEGALNVLSLVYFFFIFLLLKAYYSQRVAFYGSLLLLSMPQWIRVTLDPMMDTPSSFYALYAWVLLTTSLDKKWCLFFMSSCFLIAIKPTLVAFPLLATCFIIGKLFSNKLRFSQIIFLLGSIGCGGVWYFKNWLLHGNPLYPHLFSNVIPPNLPDDLYTANPDMFHSLWQYILTIMADHRWVLSYGPWPLICLPLLILGIKNKRVRYLLLYLCLGFLITWTFASFKNRYFMPYLITALPLMSLWVARAPFWLKSLLKFQVALNLLLFSPYFLQPVYSIYKKYNYESYMTFKYPKYPVYQQVNQSDAKKVLLVGQPAYWLTKPHQLAIISETNLDFTRIHSLTELFDHFEKNQIDTLVYDRSDTEGMAAKADPHYAKKAYQAKICRDWMNKLLNSPKIQILSESKGMVVARNLSLLNTLE
jgi:hypothetical protein